MVSVNDKAPDFTLKDSEQKDVSLAQFRGKNVLLCFFPSAFSPVCTTEMSCFNDDFSEFRALDAEILAVSVDSHWALAAFKKSLNSESVTFLSDFDKTATKSYGVLRKDGFADRAYFLIDKSGVVRWKHVMPVPGTRLENSDVLKAIKAV